MIDIVGWVTFNNQSGTTFKQAKVKLMAGDVNKVQPPQTRMMERTMNEAARGGAMPETVSEKSFDEFHLYTIARPVTLRNQETKQVEFVRGTGVKAPKIYVYDGATMTYGFWNYFRGEGEYGIQTNKKVWTLREFRNNKDNNLGMALPKGRLRFYDPRAVVGGESAAAALDAGDVRRARTGRLVMGYECFHGVGDGYGRLGCLPGRLKIPHHG